MSSVVPSEACFATYSAASTPAAPDLFSTSTLVFHISCSLGAMTRARMSVPPPGGKPTTMRIGAVGRVWARSIGAARLAAAATKVRRQIMQMAEASLLPAVRKQPEAIVVADGTSCRHQIADGAGRQAVHAARLLAGLMAA